MLLPRLFAWFCFLSCTRYCVLSVIFPVLSVIFDQSFIHVGMFNTRNRLFVNSTHAACIITYQDQGTKAGYWYSASTTSTPSFSWMWGRNGMAQRWCRRGVHRVVFLRRCHWWPGPVIHNYCITTPDWPLISTPLNLTSISPLFAYSIYSLIRLLGYTGCGTRISSYVCSRRGSWRHRS